MSFFLLPVLPNLREEFKNAQIDFLVERFAADILLDNPFIDHAIAFDARSQSSLSIILKIRRNRYDLVIDLFANPRTAVITIFSGARYRVGFPFKWRKHAYNILVQPRGGEVHNVEFNLDALTPARDSNQGQVSGFSLKQEGRRIRPETHKLVPPCASTIHYTKHWRWMANKKIAMEQVRRAMQLNSHKPWVKSCRAIWAGRKRRGGANLQIHRGHHGSADDAP